MNELDIQMQEGNAEQLLPFHRHTGVDSPQIDTASNPHASSHQSGGSDSIKLDDLAAPDDNTDLNVSTSKHGLVPKAPNDTAKFLRGDAAWAAPATSSVYGRMYRNAAQTIADTTDTKVALDTSSFASGITADTTNNRFTALTAGYYHVYGQVTYDSPVAAKNLIAAIWVNNTQVNYSIVNNTDTDPNTINISDIVNLAVDGYVELFTYHNCGGNEGLQGGSLYTYLTIHKI